MTTNLTTTAADNLPLRPILQKAQSQISHGIPQPGQIWYARGLA
jgi:hypothetical protein